MKKTSIFEYKNYKEFILDWMDKTPQQGRGQRKLLAESIGCQTPFITHVLSGEYHFSLEQAEACARFLELNENELEFFLLLVLKQRSGTKTLENYFSKKISEKCTEHVVLKKRLSHAESMSIENQMIYYSSWHYAVIHMAILIPNLQTIESLSKYFNLPVSRIISVLNFLTDHDLIEKKGQTYKIKKPVLHLEKDSPFLIQHHTLWRMKSIEAIQTQQNNSLHYSGVMSISNDDYEWVREKLAKLFEEIVQRIQNSKDEKLASICFDLFEI